MSFWSGVARGYQASEDKKQLEADRAEREKARADAAAYQDKMFEYTKERNSIIDARAVSDRELALEKWEYAKGRDDKADKGAAAAAAEAQRRYENEQRLNAEKVEREIAATERAIEAAATAEERAELKDRLDKERAELDRLKLALDTRKADLDDKKHNLNITEKFMELMPPALVGGLGGGAVKGAVVAPGKDAMVAASPIFAGLMEGLSKEEKDSEFFKAAAASPGTQATLLAFMNEQNKKNNNVTINDLPKYFSYLGMLEGQGEEEVREIMDNVLNNEDGIIDSAALVKGMMALKNYKPTQYLFLQKGAPESYTDNKAGFELVKDAMVIDAMKFLAPFDVKSPTYTQVNKLLARLQTGTVADVTRASFELARMGFGRGFAEDNGMLGGDGKSLVAGLYDYPLEDMATPGAGTVVTPEAGGGAAGEGGGGGATPLSEEALIERGLTIFENWAALEKAVANGFNEPYAVKQKNGSFRISSEGPLVEGAGEGAAGEGADVEGAFNSAPDLVYDDFSRIEQYPGDDVVYADVIAAEEGRPYPEAPVEAPDRSIQGPPGEEEVFGEYNTATESNRSDPDISKSTEILREMGVKTPSNMEEWLTYVEDIGLIMDENPGIIAPEIAQDLIKIAADNIGVSF